MKYSSSEKLLLDEITKTAHKMLQTMRGLSIGDFIRLIRNQLGMSQMILATRSGVPQATISRVEKGRKVNFSTLQKILNALSCDLIVVPVLRNSIESLQYKQAKLIAKKRMRYLKGTMNLEKQQPDEKFMEELIQQEEKQLLEGPKSKL